MNAPYLLIPIGLTLLIAYGMSLLFSRLDIISKNAHRKIWNYLLLATFLVAGILGTLMAIQINYKLEVPWTEKVLKWHVNFGLAMALVGLFHFTWHWRYYFPLHFRRGGPAGPPVNSPVNPPFGRVIRAGGPMGPPLLIGFAGVAFQTLIIRELLGLFQGNELMLSIILFLWLLITGAGAITGSKNRYVESGSPAENLRRSYLLVLALLILPLLLIPLMYYCKNLFFAPGIEAGPIAFAGFLLLFLSPFCFLNGFAFTFTTRLLGTSGMTIRKAYAWESAGGAAAGLLCTLAILTGFFTPPGGRLTEKLFHPNDEILATRSGASGRLTITKSGDQVNIFGNGLLVQSSGNTLICEEMAHFAMIQHPDPQNILVVGGLLSGITAELMKYPCHHIDLAETDRQIFKLAENLGLITEPSPPVRHIRKSITSWINHPDTVYDIILIMLPGPQNLSLNRFYTAGFFSRLKKILAPEGKISVMLTGTANYLSDEAIRAIGPVVNAVKESFNQTLIFPGENNYLIAGNSSLRTDILPAMRSSNIRALYLSEGYFDESSFIRRMGGINQEFQKDTGINTDLRPRAYFGQIAWWLGHFPTQIIWPMAIVAILLILSGLFSGRPAFSGMFILGAGASGMEIILLFLIQISAGSFYLFTGLLLAIFMAGLAFGSLKTFSGPVGRFATSESLILLSFTLLTGLSGVVAVWMTQSEHLPALKTGLILLLTFLLAGLTGLFFARLTRLFPDTLTGGRIYVFDLLGAAFGALVYPMVFIPLFGLLPAIGIISVSGILILVLIKTGRKPRT